MNRILGTMLAATWLAACGTAADGTTAPAAPTTTLTPSAKPAWTLLGNAPAPRTGHTAIYDSARDRMLVFGGGANDLWAQNFSGPNAGGWERIDAGGDVPPPIGVVGAIDEANQRLMVFPTDSLERAWVLPLTGEGEWSLVGFGAGPKLSLSFSLAVDPAGRKLYAYTSGTPEVWETPLDGGGTWTRLAGPPEVGGFSCRDELVFDGAHARLLVLSGGWPRGDVFTLSLDATATWSKLNQDQAWFDYGSSTAYDAAAGRFLVTGPATGGWIWSFAVGDASPQWTHLKIAGTPPGARWGSSGVYDSHHQRLVLFGGSGTDVGQSLHDDTWAISLGDAPAWSRLGTLDRTMPPAEGSSLAMASDNGGVVRFGGWTSGTATSSLLFDAKAASWNALGDTPDVPIAWSAGAWDPFGHRLVTFGGYDYEEKNQTWALDVKTPQWSEIDGAGARPDARSHHSMVLDRSSSRMLVFGGAQNSSYPPATYFADTWALSVDSDAWSKVDVAGPAPSPRASHAAAFDDGGRRMLVHGGEDGLGQLGDTWMLELEPSPHWTELTPAGNAPPPLSNHFAAFDPASHRFLVVGNLPSTSSASFDGVSVWALSTDGDPQWQRYCPKGTRPGVADGALWTERGLFVTAQGSAWLFDASAATCD